MCRGYVRYNRLTTIGKGDGKWVGGKVSIVVFGILLTTIKGVDIRFWTALRALCRWYTRVYRNVYNIYTYIMNKKKNHKKKHKSFLVREHIDTGLDEKWIRQGSMDGMVKLHGEKGEPWNGNEGRKKHSRIPLCTRSDMMMRPFG